MTNEKKSGTSLLGQWGEEQVAKRYAEKGYRILDFEFHCRWGEIDLILEKKPTVREKLHRFMNRKPSDGEITVVFCEVKLRRSADFAAARENVTLSKQQKIMKTALYWMQKEERGWQPMRFDVAEVYAPQGFDTKEPIINIIEGAYTADRP